ncbi:hypothetical protein POM88_042681 [Heracleum sosnowskyi]|uniref:Uncharacterized protein n=1 Tax=Heracleum sosnowskyi TaxID=360622 RepID=A0AAD8HJB1_9APIA|nr:hypothetical protein POM88_042681 [Heracleum sosnowskyi]
MFSVLYKHHSGGFLKFLKESQQVQLPSAVKKSCVGMNKQKSSGSTWVDMSPVSSDLHGNESSADQQPPIVSIPPVKKKSTALSDIMNELKRVAKPYPNLAIPKEYHSREYLGQAVPMFECVNTNSSHSGDLNCELRVDVWPVPDYWMIHGIWPCYIHRSGCIVYFGPDKPIVQAMAAGKEQVMKEIYNLPSKMKETLHKIWKSYYSQYLQFKKDAERRDISFWAYEKVVHCWDDVGLPRGEYFNTTAKVGDAVRCTLLRWMVKSDIRPNHFYDSVAWAEGMKDLYDADVHLVMKKDNDINDPEATMITYLQGMSLMMKVDNNAGVSVMDHPLPLSKSVAWQGKFFLLM